MSNKFAISFDDGFSDQYKWARFLHSCGIQGTFYINPFYVGYPLQLTLDQLKRMHDEWGHVIANHFWIHNAPAANYTMKMIIVNLLYAKE